MDWKPFVSTFTLLLLAELGDKTQLAVISQAAKFRSPLLVFLGAGAALLAVSALGVVLGQVCATCLPRDRSLRGRCVGCYDRTVYTPLPLPDEL